jgi:hypothetical protein
MPSATNQDVQLLRSCYFYPKNFILIGFAGSRVTGCVAGDKKPAIRPFAYLRFMRRIFPHGIIIDVRIIFKKRCHRTAPHRTAPHRTAPHRTAPHRTAPHRTAPHCTTLYFIFLTFYYYYYYTII